MPATNEITVSSKAFADGAPIPEAYSCTGKNRPPPLTWTVPESAVRLALIMDDPDAPIGLFTHWVVSDIPPTTTFSEEGQAPKGGVVSLNSADLADYFGPCPPTGTGVHHYRFIVHALAHPVSLSSKTPVAQAKSAIEGASVGYGQLVGTYTVDTGPV